MSGQDDADKHRDDYQPNGTSRRHVKYSRPNKIGRLQLLTICVAQLNEAIQITMPYTVAVYMVRDFESRKGSTKPDERTVGRLTGALAACFCAAQFLSSFPWGRISDRVGRKPMLVMSNLSSCISVIGFGLSSNFLMAALLRLAGGLFNCTFVCLKSMIGESCDPAGQARPLSILSLCWGLGTVIGPSLGGVLSQPCETFGDGFPMCGPGQFFRTRPFFLPCAMVGLISFIALISSLLFMEETLPSKVARRYASLEPHDELYDELKSRASRMTETEMTARSGAESDSEADEELALEAPDSGTGVQSQGQVDQGNEPLRGHTRNPWDNRVWEGQEQQHFLKRSDTASQMGGGVLEKLRAESEIRPLSPEDAGDEKQSLLTGGSRSGGPAPSPGWRQAVGNDLGPTQSVQPRGVDDEDLDGVAWYRNRQVLLTMFGYTMICLLYNLLDEVTPIYGSAARSDGGLGLTTSQLALPLALGGVSIFVWSMFFYPRVQQLLGVVNTCRLGILLTMPLCLGLALPSYLPFGPLGLQLILAAVLSFKNITATNSFTSSVIMVNTAAPQGSIGAVNGASQAAASLMRAVGPAMGGVMWGLSVALPFDGSQILPFAIPAAGFAAPLFVFGFVHLPEARVQKAEEVAAAV